MKRNCLSNCVGLMNVNSPTQYYCKRLKRYIYDTDAECTNYKEKETEREDSEGEAMVQRMLDSY